MLLVVEDPTLLRHHGTRCKYHTWDSPFRLPRMYALRRNNVYCAHDRCQGEVWTTSTSTVSCVLLLGSSKCLIGRKQVVACDSSTPHRGSPARKGVMRHAWTRHKYHHKQYVCRYFCHEGSLEIASLLAFKAIYWLFL